MQLNNLLLNVYIKSMTQFHHQYFPLSHEYDVKYVKLMLIALFLQIL